MARVALYLQFLTISDNYVEANKVLSAVIPQKFGLTLSDEEDIVFQINLPRMSKKITSVKLNVLTKWSVERIQVFTVTVPPAGMPLQTIASVPQNIMQYITPTVVFDNSTPPDKVPPLDAAQQADLLIEVLGIASEMQKENGLNITGF
jgi:hypothetical protein